MNVNSPATVPARINGGELHLAVSVGDLVSPQEFLARRRHHACPAARIVRRLIGIDSFGVAMPDVDVGACQRRAAATGEILHQDCQRERHARARDAGGWIGAEEFLVYPIRPFGDGRSGGNAREGIGRFYGLVPCGNEKRGRACAGQRPQRCPP